MGRYYTGDIEGKFMFGIQDSTDPEFFGAYENTTTIRYYIDDLEAVQKGLNQCLEHITKEEINKIDQFFNATMGYTDGDISKLLFDYKPEKSPKDDNGWFNHTDGSPKEKEMYIKTRNKLEWYARYTLGIKMRDCIKEKDYCEFEAEL